MPDAKPDLDHGAFDWEQMRGIGRPPADPPAPVDSPDPYAWRDDILDQVRLGRMSPKDAEAVARRRGARPFCGPSKQFSVFDVTLQLWTPEMALSWIAFRNASAVHRHHQPSYHDTCVWAESAMVYSINLRKSYQKFSVPKKAGLTQKGYSPVPLKGPVYPVDYLSFDGSLVSFPDVEDIYPQLRTHLINGLISAIGVPPSLHSSGINIERHHWLTGSFDIAPSEGGVLTIAGRRFTNIHFRAEGFQLAYPAKEGIRWRTVHFRRWRKPMPKMEPYKRMIVDRLQAVYQEGLPIIRPLTVRYSNLKSVLGNDNVERWYAGVDEDDPEKKHRADEAFRKAMDRILQQVLEPNLEEAHQAHSQQSNRCY